MRTGTPPTQGLPTDEPFSALLSQLQSRDVAQWPAGVIGYLRRVEVSAIDEVERLPVLLYELCEALLALLRDREQRAGSLVQKTWRMPADSPVCALVTSTQSVFVRRAAEIIRERYQEPLTTSALASELGRDRSYLATLFRRETGQTLHRYITDVRLDHAARWILQGEKIDAVVLLAGYRSKTSFYRQFKAKTGLTPGAFRSLHGP